MDEAAQAYIATLATRSAALARAKAELAVDAESAAASIRRIAHVLRGSGTTFGYPQITEAATAVEEASQENLAGTLDTLLEVLQGVTVAGSDGATPSLVLVVEDDPISLVLLQRALAAPNRRVVTAPTMAAAEWYLENDTVALAIVDIVLPDGDGRNFLLRLREQARTATIPIIVVSALKSAQVRTECYALGCDSYLAKPVDTDVLAAAADALLRRAGRAERESQRDNLTGLANRAGVRDAHARLVAAADRARSPLAVAVVDLDGFKTLNDAHGHTGGDAALKGFAQVLLDTLRRTDVLGRWGGDEFVVLMPDTERSVAGTVLSGVLEKIRQHDFPVGDATARLTFTAGIAAHEAGATLDTAIAEADKLLYRGKVGGRNVVLAGEGDAASVVRTVLVAEDDPMILSLVKHRLTRDGMDVVHAADGNTALRLADETRVALVILDVNMPGLNGFEVLEQLRARPAYARTPIMMLTSVGQESEIARALDLGADDYVIKPFSPVELLARVRRLVARA